MKVKSVTVKVSDTSVKADKSIAPELISLVKVWSSMKRLKTSVFLKESVKKEEYKCLPITYKFERLPNDEFVKSPVVKERELKSLIPA